MERIKPNRPLVGKPTGEITRAGRPVLETPEGEMVSERYELYPLEVSFIMFLVYMLIKSIQRMS